MPGNRVKPFFPACEVPEGAQLLRHGIMADKLGNADDSGVAEVAWGVPFQPEEFVDEALKTGHPRTLSALLPEILSKAVAKNAVTPIAEMAAERAAWFGHWTSRAAELRAREAALHASMPGCSCGKSYLRPMGIQTRVL